MTSLRSLLSLLIILTLLPLCVSLFTLAGHYDIDYLCAEEEISLMKLREVLLLAYDLEVQDDHLSFTYQNDHYTLSLINSKLILKPGTLIYLSSVDDLHFERRGNSIYAVYERKGKHYEKNIASAYSLSVGDFSDCDAEHPEPEPGAGELSEHLEWDLHRNERIPGGIRKRKAPP